MSRIAVLVATVLLAVFAASPGLLLKILYYSDDVYLGIQSAFFGTLKTEAAVIEEIRFVGDIMLARHVETLMRQHGADWPYQNLSSNEVATWVGNFEATVPDQHTQTPDFTFAFSVDKTYLHALSEFGFTHLSLANNHTYDFGTAVFDETNANLKNFVPFGDPNQLSSSSYTYLGVNGGIVGLLALNAVNKTVDTELLTQVVAEMSKNSDVQVAYIHWGDEYQLTHNDAQQELAHHLIDEGIDVIVGHHPHVVQDIEMYQNKLIFYSLGNFIFDQYFNDDVQEGLVVVLRIEEGELVLELEPVTSVGSVAAPRLMTKKEKSTFLQDLGRRSSPELQSAIESGTIQLTN